MTQEEQEVLNRILTSNASEATETDKAAKAESRKIRQRRKMTAAYKAHKALETLHPEEYQRIYEAAFTALGTDERYADTV
jgi:ribonucleotide reductase beta subunit family protein with ferritin-like domain